MSPNVRRFLPMFAVLAAILFIVPSLTKKHSSGPSGATKATTTLDAMNRVQKGEQLYLKAHGRYSSHTADLVTLVPGLVTDLSTVGIQLDVSSDGQTVISEVASDTLGLVRVRDATKVIASSCTILKSGSGVSCPKPTP